MRTYLGCFTVGLSLIAGGGCSSDTCSVTCGESPAGGNGSAGHNNGAGASGGGAAGNNSGGSTSAGSSSGGSASGGSSSAGTTGSGGSGVRGTLGGSGGSFTGGSSGSAGSAGSSGGARTVDARCPAQRPMGACSADDTGLACQYENVTGCLCYPNQAGTFTPCQKVNPGCPSTPAPAPAPPAGAGGESGKIAPALQQLCTCSASTWSCRF